MRTTLRTAGYGRVIVGLLALATVVSLAACTDSATGG